MLTIGSAKSQQAGPPSLAKVIAANLMLAACHTRCRIARWTDKVCATFKCSDARKRHNVDCGGSRGSFRIPVNFFHQGLESQLRRGSPNFIGLRSGLLSACLAGLFLLSSFLFFTIWVTSRD